MAGSGEVVTYAELDARSNQLAQLFLKAGLGPGDHIAVYLENHPRYLEVVWAALRSGLYLTPINRFLTADEVAYILNNADVRAVVTSSLLAPVAGRLPGQTPHCDLWLMVDGVADGYDSYETSIADIPSDPIPVEQLGELMVYSSGTTGRPKGIARPLSGAPASAGLPFAGMLGQLFGFDDSTVYLSTAPTYHSAPLAFAIVTTTYGGTVVTMEHFDALASLAAIEAHKVTHSQWVPTMFSRLLKLSAKDRESFDLSSHRLAIHAAAPCPQAVKAQMLGWWGPMLHEYYAGSELNGLTYATPQDWLDHPGTVGRPLLGTLHICDDDGKEVPTGDIGQVYFELADRSFEYHKDPAKTASAQNPHHPTWTTLGDVGRVDEEGFLYLTDRSSFMIISGGVNIYPQEIEDCLIVHEWVEDVAVIGVPSEEMGEDVKAVVQLRPGIEPSPELAAQLIEFTRAHLAHFKCPRSVDFIDELPRLPTGKLYKLQLREPYWTGSESRILGAQSPSPHDVHS